MSNIVILIALFAFSEAASSPPNSKIIGGQDTDISKHPYQISLQKNGRHSCGGSIIAERWILTAGHCTDGAHIQNLTIVAGITSLKGDGQRISVKSVHQHPKFDPSTLDYDISLLSLDVPIAFGRNVLPVILPKLGFDPKDGIDVVLTGWGATDESGRLSDILQEATIPIVDRTKCNDLYESGGFPSVTERMICASPPEGGHDHCHGDSGGPLVVNYRQVGIVSWANGCAKPGYPGVNTNVGALRDFIKNMTGL